MKSSPHPGLPPLGKESNVQDDCPRPALSSTQIVLQQPIIPFGSRASSHDPSPERPSGSSFAETPTLSSLWPIALATPGSSPGERCTRQMVHVGARCIVCLHRQSQRPSALKKSAARPEQDRSGQKSSLSERRTAGTERVSKIFAEMLCR
jgi:hypothetical protein